MKIGILTQPLHNNYGGLLQAFALQKVLTDIGHEVVTVNFANKHLAWHIKVLSVCKRLLLYIVKGGKGVIRIWPTKSESRTISKYTTEFINQHIKVTEKITGDNATQFLKKLNVDAFIVGSDQVWRPKYSPHLPSFFLDFLPAISPVRCVAYAASYGVDNWEYNDKQTAMAKTEIRKFHAVSVREDSAVELCDKYLDCKATQVLDPTLLISKEDYINIFKLDQAKLSDGKLLTYFLDETNEMSKIVQIASQILSIKPFKVMPEKTILEVGSRGIKDLVYPPVEQWLKGFLDCEYVLTDSFHGCVFSILMNKPFIAFSNNVRGMARFSSFLKIFSLENRIVFSPKEIDESFLSYEFDWSKINSVIEKQKRQSIFFLKKGLDENM